MAIMAVVVRAVVMKILAANDPRGLPVCQTRVAGYGRYRSGDGGVM
jgi:hypothetical protein